MMGCNPDKPAAFGQCCITATEGQTRTVDFFNQKFIGNPENVGFFFSIHYGRYELISNLHFILNYDFAYLLAK